MISCCHTSKQKQNSVRLCAALYGLLAEHVGMRELQLREDTRVVEELERTLKETDNSPSLWEEMLKKSEMGIEQREKAFEKKAKDAEKSRKDREEEVERARKKREEEMERAFKDGEKVVEKRELACGMREKLPPQRERGAGGTERKVHGGRNCSSSTNQITNSFSKFLIKRIDEFPSCKKSLCGLEAHRFEPFCRRGQLRVVEALVGKEKIEVERTVSPLEGVTLM
ncbi:myosin-M heavy chain-like [Anabrus simplex]|uniref:myosin-M heavy chain-like n=1 Tax=Anabrus simplex TaxID=316456 RepID=UPI0035A3A3DB